MNVGKAGGDNDTKNNYFPIAEFMKKFLWSMSSLNKS